MSEASFIIALFLIVLQCLEFLWRTNEKDRKKKRKHKKNRRLLPIDDGTNNNYITIILG